ncbi:Sterol desaturase/sphingolipid hydroxylase, fatty acid hydroxylase superfamily [Pseudidiomarina planktonica]|uniref:Sterol desaturase/sphingolipid hydroxylase, fatty acid hydroxylase superfamily n=1 Tax=Pseudidiomarina planktonica TaxID=1323738 RepID=A0A1Y6EUQ1_9GAMM|nr:sterol desaturase family protein [Pseudidiomarina planktonica]RUO65114.1 sterol desaturase family protein [Pseudidiomarina planktonica]SMQ66435.1 Sterol desaturase/sphingolipid hydroxylase, fatty acid hydroxylase superfamily [Pseudidiomarina planktonica]
MSTSVVKTSSGIWLAQVAVYPLAILACLAFLDWAAKSDFPMEAAQFIAFLTAIFVVMLCEHWMPFSQDWKRRIGSDRKIDILTLFSTMGVVFPALKNVGNLLAVVLVVWLFESPEAILFPTDLFFVTQLFMAAVIAEFGGYCLHRISHHFQVLWRFHLVHHSASRIYWMNAYRSHPINISWHYLASIFVLLLIGVPQEVVLGYSGLAGVVSVFQHANVAFKFGPLNYIFSTNEVHRWHHSTKLSEADNNYGNVLMIWDHVFGTFYLRPNESPASVGLHDTKGVPVHSFLKLMLYPFKR